MRKVGIVIPVKDEEDGLQYLIKNLEVSGIRKEYEISFLFVIDERTSDDSRDFAERISEQIIDQRLDELTPGQVKNIIDEMIRKHLGWLVVWGGAVGGFIGFGAAIV